MSDEQKHEFSKTFIYRCKRLVNLKTEPSYGLFTFIEEPLVQVLSQALFFKIYYPKYFDLNCQAYNHPLVKHYLPYVGNYYYSNMAMDDDLISKLANKYSEIRD
jgi:hypothetical protein